jgi:hypothetical protein
MNGGILKILYVHYQRQDLPLGPSDMFFHYEILLYTLPIYKKARVVHVKNWRGGYIRISGGWRVLELEADNREEVQGRALVARRLAC